VFCYSPLFLLRAVDGGSISSNVRVLMFAFPLPVCDVLPYKHQQKKKNQHFNIVA
jgi:hypothetical protein